MPKSYDQQTAYALSHGAMCREDRFSRLIYRSTSRNQHDTDSVDTYTQTTAH